VQKEGKKATKRVARTVIFQVVERLLPSGAFDPGFSRIGSAKYLDPENGSFTNLTANAGEGTCLVGNLGKRVSQSRHNQLLRRILVGGGITSPQLPSGGGFAIARYWAGK